MFMAKSHLDPSRLAVADLAAVMRPLNTFIYQLTCITMYFDIV